jgi:hypothetical protein
VTISVAKYSNHPLIFLLPTFVRFVPSPSFFRFPMHQMGFLMHSFFEKGISISYRLPIISKSFSFFAQMKAGGRMILFGYNE